jgi:hypothetical protein
MRLFKGVRRRLVGFLTAAAAATVLVTLPAGPAHATLGPPQSIDIQLTSYAGGYQTQVGRLIGTIQFDDGASAYNLTITVCRQSSYVINTVRVSVNGVPERSFSVQDGTPRSAECGGGHGLSGVYVRTISYPGVIENVAIGLEGVHFDGSTARNVGGGRFFPNPYH